MPLEEAARGALAAVERAEQSTQGALDFFKKGTAVLDAELKNITSAKTTLKLAIAQATGTSFSPFDS